MIKLALNTDTERAKQTARLSIRPSTASVPCAWRSHRASENNRDLGVKNGMLGTVEAVEPNALHLRLDGSSGGQKQRPPYRSTGQRLPIL